MFTPFSRNANLWPKSQFLCHPALTPPHVYTPPTNILPLNCYSSPHHTCEPIHIPCSWTYSTHIGILICNMHDLWCMHDLCVTHCVLIYAWLCVWTLQIQSCVFDARIAKRLANAHSKIGASCANLSVTLFRECSLNIANYFHSTTQDTHNASCLRLVLVWLLCFSFIVDSCCLVCWCDDKTFARNTTEQVLCEAAAWTPLNVPNIRKRSEWIDSLGLSSATQSTQHHLNEMIFASVV